MRRALILSVVLLIGACGEVSEDFMPAPGEVDPYAPATTEASTDQEVPPAPSATEVTRDTQANPEPSTSTSLEVQPAPGADDVTPSTSASSGPGYGSALAPLVDQAKSDLAAHLGLDASVIEVVGAELVEWSDASLGCPQPGMMYAQVPTDGSLITLSYGGVEYDYHTGGNRYVPFLCENT